MGRRTSASAVSKSRGLERKRARFHSPNKATGTVALQSKLPLLKFASTCHSFPLIAYLKAAGIINPQASHFVARRFYRRALNLSLPTRSNRDVAADDVQTPDGDGADALRAPDFE